MKIRREGAGSRLAYRAQLKRAPSGSIDIAEAFQKPKRDPEMTLIHSEVARQSVHTPRSARHNGKQAAAGASLDNRNRDEAVRKPVDYIKHPQFPRKTPEQIAACAQRYTSDLIFR